MSSGSAQCYFPNGDPAQDGETPCGSGDGVACCPLNWSCQDNGLCYLENQQYYGRYACTDKSWQSSGCPNICTHGNTAVGAEAVLECSTGSYCCDANRPDAEGDSSLGCCNTSNDRFGINNGVMVNGSDSGGASSLSAAPSTSSIASSTSVPQTPLTFTISSGFSDPAASVSTESLPITSPSQSTGPQSSTSTTIPVNQDNHDTSQSSTSIVLITSVVTKSGGGSSTLTTSKPSVVAAPASTSSPSSNPAPAKSTSKASIIAPAVAVPLAVIALAGLAFFLWRRRKQKKAATWENDSPGYQRRSEPIDMYASQKPHFPDMESPESKQSPTSYESPDQIGAGATGLGLSTAPPSYRGTSEQNPGNATRMNRHSELPGSPAFPPNSPELSTHPPGSSSSHGVTGGGLHIVNPTQEPSELPASTYHPYRPPKARGA